MLTSTKYYPRKYRYTNRFNNRPSLRKRRIFIHRTAEIVKTRPKSLQNLIKRMDRHYVQGFNGLVGVVSKMEDNLVEQLQYFLENTELAIRLLADKLTEEPALVDTFENPERYKDFL